MKKTISIIVVLALIIGGYFIFKTPKTPSNGTSLKVGVILPLTGSVAVSGEKLLQGIELAKKEFSSSQVTFVIEDNHSKTTDGVTAAKKLLDVDKVDVLVGLYIPDEVVAIAPLAQEKGVTIFSLSYCAKEFVSIPNVFCGYPSAAQQLTTVLPAVQKENIKTMALVNTNDSFGIDSRDGMVGLGGVGGSYAVVLNELVPFESKDLKTQADKVIASKADAVFMASGDTAQAFTLMKILKERGYKGMRITFVDINEKALTDFKSYVEGTFAPGMAPSQFSRDFTQKYTEAYGKKPEDYVPALAYDTVSEVLGVMQSKEFNQKDFVQQAITYKYQNSAIKDFGYRMDRTNNFALELWKVKDGKYVKAEY